MTTTYRTEPQGHFVVEYAADEYGRRAHLGAELGDVLYLKSENAAGLRGRGPLMITPAEARDLARALVAWADRKEPS